MRNRYIVELHEAQFLVVSLERKLLTIFRKFWVPMKHDGFILIMNQPMLYAFRMYSASMNSSDNGLLVPTQSLKIRFSVVIYIVGDTGPMFWQERSIELSFVETACIISNIYFCSIDKSSLQKAWRSDLVGFGNDSQSQGIYQLGHNMTEDSSFVYYFFLNDVSAEARYNEIKEPQKCSGANV